MNHKAVRKLQPKVAQASLVPADNAVDGRNAIAPIDRRPAALTQRRLQARADQSPQVARLQATQDQMNNSAIVSQAVAAPVVQLGTTKTGTRKTKKKTVVRKKFATKYHKTTYVAKNRRLGKVKFGKRPPSNSRKGQGDHIVAYALVTLAVSKCVSNKALDVAAKDLRELVKASKDFVNETNKWWHDGADNIIKSLGGVGADDDDAHDKVQSGIDETLYLLNTMPGSAFKNKKSTKGHGEGSSKNGLEYCETEVAKGNKLKGNPWVNVFAFFDGSADTSLMKDSKKLAEKIEWMMALFARAAPTIFGLIENKDTKLIPDTDLASAAQDKFGTTKGKEVSKVITNWI